MRNSAIDMKITECSHKPADIKMHNQKLILSIMRESETMSAADLSERINLSKTTVMRVLERLREQGIIVMAGKGSSTQEGGKKPQLFKVNDTFRYSVSALIGKNGVIIGILNFSGKLVHEETISFSESSDMDSSLKEMAEGIGRVLAENNIEFREVCGIAVSIDGVVNSETGIVNWPIHNSSWGRNVPLLECLEKHLPMINNIVIENSGRVLAYNLMSVNSALKTKRLFMVYAGNHSSGCLYENGNIYHGKNCYLGEIGHVPVLPGNQNFPCECGNYGCFETLVSPNGVRYWSKELEQELGSTDLSKRIAADSFDMQELFEAADKGDVFARRLADKLTAIFVKLFKNIVVLCDPEILLISGLYAPCGSYFLETVKSRLYDGTFYSEPESVQIICVPAGEQDCIFGGGRYILDHYISEETVFGK